MNASTLKSLLEKTSISWSVKFGSRQQQITDQVKGKPPQLVKDEIERMRPDSASFTVFAEEGATQDEAEQLAQHFHNKLDFQGEVVRGSKPASNGNTYVTAHYAPQPPSFDADEWL